MNKMKIYIDCDMFEDDQLITDVLVTFFKSHGLSYKYSTTGRVDFFIDDEDRKRLHSEFLA